MRENEARVQGLQGACNQMRVKIDNVREALERQARLLEETHQRLEQLSGRLHQMEEQSRIRDLERLRAQEREEQRLEDERWVQEWEAMCISERLHPSKKEGRNRGDDGSEEADQRGNGSGDSLVPTNEMDQGTKRPHRQGVGL